jgi:hypothetical protein
MLSGFHSTRNKHVQKVRHWLTLWDERAPWSDPLGRLHHSISSLAGSPRSAGDGNEDSSLADDVKASTSGRHRSAGYHRLKAAAKGACAATATKFKRISKAPREIQLQQSIMRATPLR